ncbi:MAG: FAD-dependent oxidoreductase [Flavobacteriaceae bacterium]|nr:FAD-dependent oxidoreductase [Flavobacteriaceae bacterium]
MSKVYFSTWRDEHINNIGKKEEDWTESAYNLPAQYDEHASSKAFIGWDGVALFDPDIDVVKLATEYAHQYQEYSEACGRCAPGRWGGRILYDSLDKIARGEGSIDDMEHLKEIGKSMQITSKCEIGKTVPNPILDLMTHFEDEFMDCIKNQKPSKHYTQEIGYIAKITAPCTDMCPAHVDIPGYIEGVRDLRFNESIEATRQTMPLAHVCGRVCPHPCEDACRRGNLDEAVSIMSLKRLGADYETDHGYDFFHPIEKKQSNGKKVAIIGAGPAGLTAAYYLALKGYDITIYEAQAHAGGMVMYGIPKYRFPIESIDKQIEYMESIGVKIKYNTKVGKDIMFDEIYETNDAVFVGIGLQKPWNIGIKNEDTPGVIPAIDYLKIINGDKKYDVGKKVAVIGGGNVAIDGARVAARFDTEVTILYRRRVEDMPADWEEIEGAEHEGVKIIPQAIPTRIIKDDKSGKVIGIEYVKAEMITQDGGRPRPIAIEGSETIYECDTVIGAIGQQADFEWLPEKYKNDIIIERGKIQVNDLRQTGNSKIFAGGDSVKYGNSDAISAIADGFNAVKGIDKLLLKVKS